MAELCFGENSCVGEGAEELDVDYAGEPIEIGFNASYVPDVPGDFESVRV